MWVSRFAGTLRYVRLHWPTYLFGLGGGALLAIMVTITAVSWGWWGVIPVVLAGLLLLYYFLFASLWAAHQLYDNTAVQPADTLFFWGELRPDDQLVIVSLGDTQTAEQLVRHITVGKVTVVDIYDPQIMPAKVLVRLRAASGGRYAARHDPRLAWQTGRVDLLPLPDASVFAVLLINTVGYVAENRDRDLLMREIFRIVRPGGRLLMTEPVRTQTQWLVQGIGALNLRPLTYWRTLLADNGLTLVREQTQQGLVSYMRADKVTAGVGRQLPFDWNV